MIWPVVKYAPISARKPIIANLPFSFSAKIFSFFHLIWVSYFSLEPARNDLTSCYVCTNGCYETKHCCPAIKFFCFRSHCFLISYVNKYNIHIYFCKDNTYWRRNFPLNKHFWYIYVFFLLISLFSKVILRFKFFQ